MTGKKPFSSPERAYRSGCRAQSGERAFQVVLEQSDLWIVADSDLSAQALQSLHRARGQVAAQIALQPEFATSFAPLAVQANASPIVRDMALAGARCEVGPMAAVAGAVAEAVAWDLAGLSRELLVENGGDCFLISSRERVVGLLSDPEQGFSLGLRFQPEQFPLALCSSSAHIGHSVSLGQGELVAVLSPNGAFADAAATALCNLLRDATDLDPLLVLARQWSMPEPGFPAGHVLRGVFAQCKGRIAAWGELELTPL